MISRSLTLRGSGLRLFDLLPLTVKFHVKIELDPVARYSIKGFLRCEQSRLDSLAHPRFQIVLLVKPEVLAVPLVNFRLEPQVRQIIAAASAERNKVIDFPWLMAARIEPVLEVHPALHRRRQTAMGLRIGATWLMDIRRTRPRPANVRPIERFGAAARQTRVRIERFRPDSWS